MGLNPNNKKDTKAYPANDALLQFMKLGEGFFIFKPEEVKVRAGAVAQIIPKGWVEVDGAGLICLIILRVVGLASLSMAFFLVLERVLPFPGGCGSCRQDTECRSTYERALL